MRYLIGLQTTLALVLLTAGAAAGKPTTRRAVRVNHLGGTDTCTLWTARNTTFLALKRTTGTGAIIRHRFAHKAGDPSTLYLTTRTQTDRHTETETGSSWRVASGMIREHETNVLVPNQQGARPCVTRCETFAGDRILTRIRTGPLGTQATAYRQIAPNSHEVETRGENGTGCTIVRQGRVPRPRIRLIYDQARSILD